MYELYELSQYQAVDIHRVHCPKRLTWPQFEALFVPCKDANGKPYHVYIGGAY